MRPFGIMLVTTLTTFVALPVLLSLRSKITTVQVASRFGRSGANGRVGLTNELELKMHCCDILGRFTVTLEHLCRTDGSIQQREIAKQAETQRCTCIDFFYCKLVVVTAISSNHYNEVQDMIASVQKFLPSTKLIVYDLGLSAEEKEKVQQHSNIEVRPFVFEKYPPHTKNLETYAWKTFIIDEITSEYEVVFWGDASVRVMGPFFAEKVFPLLLKFPFVAGSTLPLPIVSLTHYGMLQYLNLPLSRNQMGHFGHIEAGCWVMWANSLMKFKFLNYWVDCALHQECIAPHGSNIWPCDFKLCNKTKGAGVYIGCHRYDQSALDMILIREFGLEVWNLTVHNKARALFHIHRNMTTWY